MTNIVFYILCFVFGLVLPDIINRVRLAYALLKHKMEKKIVYNGITKYVFEIKTHSYNGRTRTIYLKATDPEAAREKVKLCGYLSTNIVSIYTPHKL